MRAKNLRAHIPNGVDFESAAFVMLGAIALHGVRMAQPTLGERVVVLGLGLLGQITVQVLRAAGCRVFGVDLVPQKVSLATIPGKTSAYLACGRPILCVVAGDAADVVRGAGAGLVCLPEDSAALAQAVRDLYAMPAEQRKSMGQSGRRAFLANCTRAVLMGRYEELLIQVAQRHKRGRNFG